jgi:ATP-dependent Zn protease
MTFPQHRAFVAIRHITVIIAICLLAFLLNRRAYHSPGMQARFMGFDPSIAKEALVPELLFDT